MCQWLTLQAECASGPVGTKLLEAAWLSILPCLLLQGNGLGGQGGFPGETLPPWEAKPVGREQTLPCGAERRLHWAAASALGLCPSMEEVGRGVGHYCPAFEVNQRNGMEGVNIASGMGQFLSPCYWDIFALLCQGCGLGGWGAAARGTAVLCCCALPFPVLDGPAICGAVLWNRIRKWSDQALQK